jgi:hypothetical protein
MTSFGGKLQEWKGVTTAVIDPRLHPRHIIFSSTIDQDAAIWESFAMHNFHALSQAVHVRVDRTAGPVLPTTHLNAVLLGANCSGVHPHKHFSDVDRSSINRFGSVAET